MILKRKVSELLLIFSFISTTILWSQVKLILPDNKMMEPPSHVKSLLSISFGREFYFRIKALNLQFLGDGFGNNTNLNAYDYRQLDLWFNFLDSLNNSSNFTPSLAAYYFANANNNDILLSIVSYLHRHAINDVENKWWWIYQASFIAKYKLHDLSYAIKLASLMNQNNSKKIPIWAKQLPAFLFAEYGETETAISIINNILQNSDHISESEKNFMNYFINKMIKSIK